MPLASVRAAPSSPIRAAEFRLPVETLPQPDETTCGPTCLHAVYRYWGENERLEDVIALEYVPTRGPLARRLLRAVGPRPSRGALHELYAALCDALEAGEPFDP